MPRRRKPSAYPKPKKVAYQRGFIKKFNPLTNTFYNPYKFNAVGSIKSSLNSPFPTTLFTKLKYTFSHTLASTAGSVDSNLFRLNSLYDPDETGAGAQPRYFDTFCGANAGSAPYNQYRVHMAKVNARFVSTTSSVSSGTVWVQPYRVSGCTTKAGIMELPMVESRTVNSLGVGDKTTANIKMIVPMKKMLSCKDLRDNDDASAPYNANPNDVCHLIIGYIDDLGNSSGVVLDLEIVYYVEFFDLNKVSQS